MVSFFEGVYFPIDFPLSVNSQCEMSFENKNITHFLLSPCMLLLVYCEIPCLIGSCTTRCKVLEEQWCQHKEMGTWDTYLYTSFSEPYCAGFFPVDFIFEGSGTASVCGLIFGVFSLMGAALTHRLL